MPRLRETELPEEGRGMLQSRFNLREDAGFNLRADGRIEVSADPPQMRTILPELHV